MKTKRIIRKQLMLLLALALICAAVCAPVMYSIGITMAEPNSTVIVPELPQQPHRELKVGESKTIVAGNAYVWTNTDNTVIRLDAERVNETATVTGLKPGTATVSVGTIVGQVLTFTYIVTDDSGTGGGDDDNGGGDDNTGGGGDDTGDADKLKEIPGLGKSTPVDTVLNINGSEWIVIKNIEMEGSRYAMLLKKTPVSHIIFEMSGSSYEGSSLQTAFTEAFTDSHIPEAIMHNAVVPKLGDDSTNAVSAPTSKMASSVTSKKDIIFPLSYKEAVDWSGSTNNDKLHMSSLRWWLRTPDNSKWHYVITYSSAPNEGSIISSPTVGLQPDTLRLRPAIWVKYE